MKRKALVTTILAAILLTMCATMFCACVDEEPEPREVELELVNPITGKKVEWGETIELPEDGTPIRVRIKDKETGEYLTDDDLPENTISNSCKTQFIILDNEGHRYRQEGYIYWPTIEDIEDLPYYDTYGMQISFDCRPNNPEDPKTFRRKYKMDTEYVRFYINKSWREEDNI